MDAEFLAEMNAIEPAHCTFSPSSFPAWAQCGQFKRRITEATETAGITGTQKHAMLKSLATGAAGVVEIMDMPDDVCWAFRVIQDAVNERDANITAVERKVESKQLGYWGTPDIVAENAYDVIVIDLKTGAQQYDATLQLAAYGLAYCEERGIENKMITMVEVWTQTRRVYSSQISVSMAESIVGEALRMRHNGIVSADPCDYCDKCQKAIPNSDGEICPTIAHANAVQCQAATLLPTEVEDAADRMRTFEAVMANPTALGQFLAIADIIADYRDAARAKAIEYMSEGTDVKGWHITRRKGSRRLTVAAKKAVDEFKAALPADAYEIGEPVIALKKDK